MRPLLKNALQRALFRNRWKPPLLLKTEIQNKTKQNKNNIYKWNRWISSEIRWKSSKYFFSPAGYATQIQNKLTSGGKKKKPQMKGKEEFLAICTEGLTVLYQIIPPPCVDFLLIRQALGQPVLLQGILKRRASEIVSSSC